MDEIESAFIVTAMTSCLVLIGAAILTAFLGLGRHWLGP
jgi:hypothetical protein